MAARPLIRCAIAALVAALALVLAMPARAAEPTRVVLIGIGGLRWSDASAENTPTLLRLAERAAIGTLSVRAVDEPTCPLDGWLTLSAGVRAAGAHPCAGLPKVDRGRVDGWDELVAAQQSTGYGAHLGRLGDALASANVCATSVGPGAAVALADHRGQVAQQATGVTARLVAACPLTIVDAGSIPSAAGRDAALRNADRLLADVIAAVGSAGTILVAGLSDEADAQATKLRLGLAAGPGFAAEWLGSTSTRQDELAQLTDLTPTLTDLTGVGRDPAFVGSRWRAVGDRPDPLGAAIADLRGFDTAERVVRQQSTWLFVSLAVIQLFGYGTAVLANVRGWGSTARRRTRRLAVLTALVAGSVPVSVFLADLMPWNLSPHPSALLWAALLGFTALVAFSAGLAPREPRWIAPTVIAAITTIVLAADVTTGSQAQTGNLMTPGNLPVVGGRFFGFGNVAFSIFAGSALVLAGGVAAHLRRTGRRSGWPAALGIGAAAVLVDGWPGWGADFGGVLTLVPAVVVLVAGVAGVRLSIRRTLLTAVAAVAVVAIVAVTDWLRPAKSRSHLGGFVQQVLNGDAVPVIARKAEMSLGTVVYGGPLAWVAVVILVLAALVVLRPERFKAEALATAYQDWPTLEPTLRAILVLGLVGFAVNDSGLIVPAAVFVTALPLVVIAVVRSQRPPDPPPGE
jgi:hypothetical protein